MIRLGAPWLAWAGWVEPTVVGRVGLLVEDQFAISGQAEPIDFTVVSDFQFAAVAEQAAGVDHRRRRGGRVACGVRRPVA